MVVRARPASSLPAEVAGALAERAGVELAAGGNDSEAAANRRSGVGALLGYGVGLGVGGTYGLRPPALAWRRWSPATCPSSRSG